MRGALPPMDCDRSPHYQGLHEWRFVRRVEAWSGNLGPEEDALRFHCIYCMTIRDVPDDPSAKQVPDPQTEPTRDMRNVSK